MGVRGYFLFRGDKTVCGGKILEGCTDHQFFDKDMACEGHKVTCGKHPGHYRICGGLEDDIHGKRIAGTLHSFSSCPCKSKFVPSNWYDDYELGGEPTVTHMDLSHLVEMPELPGPIADPETDTFADTCKPEDNPLLNGVYIWTETTDAGHAFVSVHQDNSIYLYTYGRYGRTGPGNLTGDGILNFLQGEDARVYYRAELYRMGARAFRIDDADPAKTRQFFENLWNKGEPAIRTAKMKETTQRRGHTIDEYDVTGNNCTTHTVEGIKFAGSTVFEHNYTSTTTQIPIESEEDFTIPVSLQRYLESKSSDFSSMTVVEMTGELKKMYPNKDNLSRYQESPKGKMQHIAAETAATGDSLSQYSSGTFGGVLGGSYDIDE
ncbi:PAAR domain-containing protein [Enterobacter kobei]|uniref:PAAR domain-containing protein n=2 Tax=Enterobacter kobei TaxID=208224 RepID=UPI0018C2E140|nr:PAAR domain-containing protein [Enterobacter kobei]MBG0641202.1 PAAR domain-containing protein [Enterobacter kobei]MCK7106772.1 PAAR domain-containing protein [Enterobacter kobei]MCK7347833.1 PAAR domain-containing protein [Enterobacter kobei]HCM9180382.1 PAAR domain-containing protein [Enterobacter kobei]HCM9537592.1 PAAR domain-containing protein [Enterobacter kobei]